MGDDIKRKDICTYEKGDKKGDKVIDGSHWRNGGRARSRERERIEEKKANCWWFVIEGEGGVTKSPRRISEDGFEDVESAMGAADVDDFRAIVVLRH